MLKMGGGLPITGAIYGELPDLGTYACVPTYVSGDASVEMEKVFT
jgi:hypothetical protein